MIQKFFSDSVAKQNSPSSSRRQSIIRRHPRAVAILFVVLLSTALLFGLKANRATAYPADEFVTTWKTNNPGESDNTSVKVQVDSGFSYDYEVDWNNDGVYDQSGLTGNVTHDFGTAGTYVVRIRGKFPALRFANYGDKEKILSVEQWGAIEWGTFNRAYYGASNMVINASDTPNLSKVTDMEDAFRSTNLGSGGGNWAWDTNNVEKMSRLFYYNSSFNQDISSWNTSNVTSMDHMFDGASLFNQDISSWNTGKVQTMEAMFKSSTNFNQDISRWNVSSVVNFGAGYDGMFTSATAFNQDINGWNTGSATSMDAMFEDAASFNQPLGNWDVSKVTTMRRMFMRASVFNQDISDWDTGSLEKTGGFGSIGGMFAYAYAFNQDISGWDMSRATDMRHMFYRATSFDQDLSSWNVASVTTAANMFELATLSTNNYDALLNGWNTQSLKSGVAFHGGNSKYCAGATARANMISSYSWVISDSGDDCSQATPTDVLLDGVHSKSIDENNTVGSTVGTLSPVDLTPGDGHTFGLSCTNPGVDDARFSISSTNLIATASFDYENPADANLDNIYEICVRVSDSTSKTHDQKLTVIVQDISDTPVQAAQSIPYKINFQGRLTTNTGTVVTNGSYNIKFTIYNAATGGTQLWQEFRQTTSRVQIASGIFSVRLGDVTPLTPNLFENSTQLYLQVELPTPATAVCSTVGCGVFTEGPLSPRQPIAASPYVFNTDAVDGINGNSMARNDQVNIFNGNQTAASNSVTALSLLQGANNVCDVSNNCSYAADSSAMKIGGNSTGSTLSIGTNDANAFYLRTAGVDRMRIMSDGDVKAGIARAAYGSVATKFGVYNDDPAKVSVYVQGASWHFYDILVVRPLTGSTSAGLRVTNNGLTTLQGTSYPDGSLLVRSTAGVDLLKVGMNDKLMLGAGGGNFGAIKKVTYDWNPPSTADSATSAITYGFGKSVVFMGVKAPATPACGGAGCLFTYGDAYDLGGSGSFTSAGSDETKLRLKFSNRTGSAVDPPNSTWTFWYMEE